jgi:phage I-like protein
MAQRALKTDEEIGNVPLDQPVLIELPSGMDTSVMGFDELGDGKGKTAANDDGAAALQEQLNAALAAQQADRDRADRAERLAAQRSTEAEEARNRANALEGDVISGGLNAAQGELASAKAEFVRAGEAGDYAAMAEAQARVGRASAQIVNLEGGAAEVAERKPAPQPQQQPRQASFSENVRANPALMTSERDWMIRNERHFGDADFNRKLEFAYQGAMNKGIVRGSPEYFEHIERATGLKAGSADTDTNERQTNVQAPVSRSERGSDGRAASPNTVTLSPEQREIARSLGITEIEYATQVRNLEAARKADPERYR